MQFLRFLGHAVRGDFGTSYRTHRPVATDLASAFPATLELVLASFVVALLLVVSHQARKPVVTVAPLDPDAQTTQLVRVPGAGAGARA